MARGAVSGVRHGRGLVRALHGRCVGAVPVPGARCRWGLNVARSKWKADKAKRDGEAFAALPHVVLESPGYRMASHTARSLLIDIAMQYTGSNNGKLTACEKYLKPKGWRSNDTVVRAWRELIDCGLLIETRKGGFPNTSAWFALSWQVLDQAQGLDIDAKRYRSGEHMRPEKPATKNAAPVPSGGATAAFTAPSPSGGARAAIVAPSHGAMRGTLTPSPVPSGGAYLETPSIPAAAGSVGAGAAFSASLLIALHQRTGINRKHSESVCVLKDDPLRNADQPSRVRVLGES
jgi:hypothetical protein